MTQHRYPAHGPFSYRPRCFALARRDPRSGMGPAYFCGVVRDV